MRRPALLTLGWLCAACGDAPWEPSWEGTYAGHQGVTDAQGVGETRPGRVALQRASAGTGHTGTWLTGLWNLDGCVVELQRSGDELVQEEDTTCRLREEQMQQGTRSVRETRWTLGSTRASRSGDGTLDLEARLETRDVQVEPDGVETTLQQRVVRVVFSGTRVAE